MRMNSFEKKVISRKADCPRQRALLRFRRFSANEEGTVTVLAFVIFVMFLIMGGIGLDTMRHEMARASLQATLDRAVLAGAMGTSNEMARDIVEDYFLKSDKANYLKAEEPGEIDIKLNSAKVSAKAEVDLDTYLMKLSGIDTLTAKGASTAEINIPKMEIVMVLDVSGSMMGARIDALRPAAKEFVTSIMDSTTPGDSVISVVPFSWSVTPSYSIFDALTVNKNNDYSSCIEFATSDYQTTEIDPNTAYDQMLYTSREGTTFGDLTTTSLASFDDTYYQTCYTDDYSEILAYSINKTALHNKIDALQAGGSTSGSEGIKWAAGLLDPAFQPVVQALQQNQREGVDAEGNPVTYYEVDQSLSNLPAEFDEGETLKVIVMMGDGANDKSYTFTSTYRGANSDLFNVKYNALEFQYAFRKTKVSDRRYGSDGLAKCSDSRWQCVYEATGPEQSVYYLRRPSDSKYYSIAEDKWLTSTEFTNLPTTLQGFISSTRLDWETAWGLMSPRYYYNKTGSTGPWNNFLNNSTSAATKDTRMSNICSAAKANNVVIYTIAFEMGSQPSAASKIQACASSVAHHYNATTVNIKSAFSAIAANVKQLRLTQ